MRKLVFRLYFVDWNENKLQRQKILIFIRPIYNHNWRNIITIYIGTWGSVVVKATSRTVLGSIPGGVTGDFSELVCRLYFVDWSEQTRV